MGQESSIDKILVIRIDAVGDTLLTIPLLKTLREKYPEALIAYLASPAGAQVLHASKLADEVLIIDYHKSSLIEKIRLAKKLYHLKFDICLNVTEKIWGYIWAFFSSSLKIGFFSGINQPLKSILIYPLMSHKVACKNFNMHEVERHLMLLSPLGHEVEDPPDLKTARQLMAGPPVAERLKTKDLFSVGLQLTKKWMDFGWDEGDLAELICRLEKEFCDIQVIHSKLEDKLADELKEKFKGNKRVIFVKGTEFLDWVEKLKKIRCLVTMDSGASHLASALDIFCIDIFNEENFASCAVRWHPWKSPYCLVKRKSIRNLSEIEEEKCKEEFFEEIIRAVVSSK